VADITGRFPVTSCCHQAQQCPQFAYALKLAGLRCWAGGSRGWIMDWLLWRRSHCTLGVQGDFGRMAETNDFLTLVGHPTCWATADWGGLYEFCMLSRRGGPGPYPRPANISKSQPRSPEDQKAALELVRKILQWIKTRDDVGITTYAELCGRDEDDRVRWITMQEALGLARRVCEKLTYIADFGTSLSPAEADFDELRISAARGHSDPFTPAKHLDSDAETLAPFHYDGSPDATPPEGAS
jgi:hypothetical protein